DLIELSSMEADSTRTLKRPSESSNSGFDCTDVIVQRLQIEPGPKVELLTPLHHVYLPYETYRMSYAIIIIESLKKIKENFSSSGRERSPDEPPFSRREDLTS